jgi:hypothetical protein
MLKEGRKTQCQSIKRIAKIFVGVDALPRDCLVTDISDGGVRLHVEGTAVPDQFSLMVQTDPPMRRQCRVIWRLGYEIGAEFVASETSARR